jgi:hypothetical protein
MQHDSQRLAFLFGSAQGAKSSSLRIRASGVCLLSKSVSAAKIYCGNLIASPCPTAAIADFRKFLATGQLKFMALTKAVLL